MILNASVVHSLPEELSPDYHDLVPEMSPSERHWDQFDLTPVPVSTAAAVEGLEGQAATTVAAAAD